MLQQGERVAQIRAERQAVPDPSGPTDTPDPAVHLPIAAGVAAITPAALAASGIASRRGRPMTRSNCTNTNLATTHTPRPDHRSARRLDRCREAETVRRQWLRTFLPRKTATKGTASFLSAATAYDADTIADLGGNHLAAEVLGVEGGRYIRSRQLPDLVEGAGFARAQVIHPALVLAAHERAASRRDWRYANRRTRRYLTQLAAFGSTLSEGEPLATTEATNA